MQRIIEHIAAPDEDGWRARDIMSRKLGFSSRQLLRAKQRPGGICIDGQPARAIDTLRAGQVLAVCVAGESELSQNIVPVPGELDIVHEDEDILVLNKPGNIPVHPSHGYYESSLANRVMHYYQRQEMQFVFRAVGRLDRGTSGLLVVAKHAHAQVVLQREMEQGLAGKEYLAVVRGRPDDAGTIDAPIGRAPGSVITRRVDPEGARAVTHYQTLEAWGPHSLVRLRLETGRTHQIRVHMAHIGHPLAGDFLYGQEEESIPRAALHAQKLEFTHPVSGQQMTFTVPMPQDMMTLKI